MSCAAPVGHNTLCPRDEIVASRYCDQHQDLPLDGEDLRREIVAALQPIMPKDN